MKNVKKFEKEYEERYWSKKSFENMDGAKRLIDYVFEVRKGTYIRFRKSETWVLNIKKLGKINEERTVQIKDRDVIKLMRETAKHAKPHLIIDKLRKETKIGEITLVQDYLPLLGSFYEIEGEREKVKKWVSMNKDLLGKKAPPYGELLQQKGYSFSLEDMIAHLEEHFL